MAKYLVTGGLGFVGSHLSEELVNQGHDITILDNLSNGQLSNISKIKDKVTVYIAQVEQLQYIIFNNEFDGVFHLATAPQ